MQCRTVFKVCAVGVVSVVLNGCGSDSGPVPSSTPEPDETTTTTTSTSTAVPSPTPSPGPAPAPTTPCQSMSFPSEPDLVAISGRMSSAVGGQTMDGPVQMWKGDHNIKISTTLSLDGVTETEDQLIVCSDGVASMTQHVDVSAQGEEQSSCQTQQQQGDCSSLSLFGDGSAATCIGRQSCPSGSGQCDVWEIASPALSAAVAGKRLHDQRSPGLLRDGVTDSPSKMFYKKGTNVVDTMTGTSVTQEGQTVSFQYTFDTWDDHTPLASDTFTVPDSWQPCNEQSEKLVAV